MFNEEWRLCGAITAEFGTDYRLHCSAEHGTNICGPQIMKKNNLASIASIGAYSNCQFGVDNNPQPQHEEWVDWVNVVAWTHFTHAAYSGKRRLYAGNMHRTGVRPSVPFFPNAHRRHCCDITAAECAG